MAQDILSRMLRILDMRLYSSLTRISRWKTKSKGKSTGTCRSVGTGHGIISGRQNSWVVELNT